MTTATASAVRWERLHPLSPVVRSGRALIILPILLLSATGGSRGPTTTRLVIDLGVIVLAAIAAVVSWMVTRWSFDGATVRVETGLLRRDARQLPVARIQAVDVVSPLLARFFGLAELRITVAGGAKDARLAYLSDTRATAVRASLLAAHHGQHPATPEPAEVATMTVPAGRLVASVALSPPMFILAIMVAGLFVLAGEAPRALPGVLGALFTYLLALGLGLWRRFASLYGFAVATAPDGVRIRRGLLNTVAETIPLRRIQAVRQVEPLLWRMLGWCRLEVDLARTPGRERASGTGEVRKSLLPVGSLADAAALRAIVIGSVGYEPSPPPRRARFKTPFSFHFLAAGHDDTLVTAVTGRVCRRTCWVPLEKLQSVRRVQGPVQRRLRLANVHVDVAGRRVDAEFRDRDAAEAELLVTRLATLSRVARSRALPDPPRLVTAPIDALTAPGAVAQAPAGWNRDPTGRHGHRYWDGSRWTDYVSDGDGTTALDPLQAVSRPGPAT